MQIKTVKLKTNAVGSVTGPRGLSTGAHRVYRGGSWGSDARDCRAASRILNT